MSRRTQQPLSGQKSKRWIVFIQTFSYRLILPQEGLQMLSALEHCTLWGAFWGHESLTAGLLVHEHREARTSLHTPCNKVSKTTRLRGIYNSLHGHSQSQLDMRVIRVIFEIQSFSVHTPGQLIEMCVMHTQESAHFKGSLGDSSTGSSYLKVFSGLFGIHSLRTQLKSELKSYHSKVTQNTSPFRNLVKKNILSFIQFSILMRPPQSSARNHIFKTSQN